jgi:hypothetical protein
VRMFSCVVLWCLLEAPLLARAELQDDARPTFDAWLRYQNEGDFEAYDALYWKAKGFRHGQSGKSIAEDAAWVKERRRLLSRKMTVRADDLAVGVLPRGTQYTFTERWWLPGAVVHVAKKELFFLKTPAGYRITREDLYELPNNVTVRPLPLDRDATRFAFVVDGEVVLDQSPEDAWAKGKPEYDRKYGDFVLTKREIDPSKIPADIARLKGMRFKLMQGVHGLSCEAVVGGFLLRGRVSTEEPEKDPEALWEQSSHALVATLAGKNADCLDATWAVAASGPEPVVVVAQSAAPDIKQLALDAFRALPPSRKLQRDFAHWYKAAFRERAPAWFEHEEPPAIQTVSVPNGGPTLVSVSAYLVAEYEDLDKPQGWLWALWEVRRNGAQITLIPRNNPDGSRSLVLTGAIVLPNDDSATLLFSELRGIGRGDQNETILFGGEGGYARMIGDLYTHFDNTPGTPVWTTHQECSH